MSTMADAGFLRHHSDLPIDLATRKGSIFQGAWGLVHVCVSNHDGMTAESWVSLEDLPF
jgi:hypothetical protein